MFDFRGLVPVLIGFGIFIGAILFIGIPWLWGLIMN